MPTAISARGTPKCSLSSVMSTLGHAGISPSKLATARTRLAAAILGSMAATAAEHLESHLPLEKAGRAQAKNGEVPQPINPRNKEPE